MKLVLKEYLASLKERGELDAVLPDLLSELGLIVFSRPGRGTRQDGVDVGAVGSFGGGVDKVYLFSIKPGDLKRRDWDNETDQSLRKSLNQIQDAYIPHRLPPEHRGKDIVICIAFGGDVEEQLRPDLSGYIAQIKNPAITFEEWGGDKLAELIQSSFLREDLLPTHARSRLRKSLAMIDEPDVSYRHFAALIRSLSSIDAQSDGKRITAMRQISISLWILLAWAREAENTESAYLSSEVALLHAWDIFRQYLEKDTKTARAAESAFISVFFAHQRACSEFLLKNVVPYAAKLHAISSSVRASCSLDVNLKLFDLLGRLGTDGIWAFWNARRFSDEESEFRDASLKEAHMYASSIVSMISNNPALLLPVKDDQAIDIFIAASLLAIFQEYRTFVKDWVAEIVQRAEFSFEAGGKYPCVLRSYSELLEHPKSTQDDYRKNSTSASLLYPVLALWAALMGDENTYSKVSRMKQTFLSHCTFQFWFPDESSEAHLYVSSGAHGAAMVDVPVHRSLEEFLGRIFSECEQSAHFKELSAVRFGWWPLIVVACRHYRLPLPLHLLEGLRKDLLKPNAPATNSVKKRGTKKGPKRTSRKAVRRPRKKL